MTRMLKGMILAAAVNALEGLFERMIAVERAVVRRRVKLLLERMVMLGLIAWSDVTFVSLFFVSQLRTNEAGRHQFHRRRCSAKLAAEEL